MTANPDVRRRASRIAIGTLAASVVLIVVLAVVAVITLRSSEEGTDVEAEDRLTQQFPSTPVGMVAVIDGQRLTSLVVAVVDPSGQGGSLVTLPINTDTTNGIGDERTPFARRAFDPGDATALIDELAPVLGIEPSFAEVVDAERLSELLGGIDGAVVAMPQDVVDVGGGDGETVAEFGERRLPADTLVDVLTSVSAGDIDAYETHDIDVATWTGIAEEWSLTTDALELDRDDAGTPAEPAGMDELMTRLRSGRVEVRDLAIDQRAGLTADNVTGADYVILDNGDRQLVFAAIAPERVLTPNPTLTFSIEAPFNSTQVAAVGEGITTEVLVRELIAELLFVEANVVFVDVEPADEGASTETVIVAGDQETLDAVDIEELIGAAGARIAARAVDGSDVTLELGTDFLDHRAELIAEREAARAETDDGADFDVSGDGADTVDSDE